MSTYNLSILTPQGEVFNGAVQFLLVTGQSGDLGLMANHAPIIAAIKRGVMKVSQEGQDKFFAHESGVLEVKPNHEALVLLDDAWAVASVAEGKEKLAGLVKT